MRGVTAKRLRQIAHQSAENYIGRPHYTIKTAAGEIIQAVFGFIKYTDDGKMIRYIPKYKYQMTIRCNGTRRIYRDLKRRFKQARTRKEKQAILNYTDYT